MKVLRLTLFTALEVLAFAGALLFFLYRIVAVLDRIGGNPTSYLAKIRFGVSAIEKETSHLGPELARLNQGLVGLLEKFQVVEGHLKPVAEQLQTDKERAT